MGGKTIAKSLKNQVKESGLEDTVSIKKCDCLGMCGQAPAIKLKKSKLKFSGPYPADTAKLLAEITRSASKNLAPLPQVKPLFKNKAV